MASALNSASLGCERNCVSRKKAVTPWPTRRPKRETERPRDSASRDCTVGGSWQWSPARTRRWQPRWTMGTMVVSSVAWPTSSISMPWKGPSGARTPPPAEIICVQTTSASCKTCTRSCCSARNAARLLAADSAARSASLRSALCAASSKASASCSATSSRRAAESSIACSSPATPSSAAAAAGAESFTASPPDAAPAWRSRRRARSSATEILERTSKRLRWASSASSLLWSSCRARS
mmetsp:Transcript_51665/g.162349  ORF Transcript_51665/g.162349 Transcript_51665/m.162349 type:complete len:238 (-) Transcript_51665:442-1155(-)